MGAANDLDKALILKAGLGLLPAWDAWDREILGELPDLLEFYCESLAAGKLKRFWKGKNSL